MGISAVGWSIAPLPPHGVCIASPAGFWTDLDDEMLEKYSAVLNPEKATYDVVDQATKERLIMERIFENMNLENPPLSHCNPPCWSK